MTEVFKPTLITWCDAYASNPTEAGKTPLDASLSEIAELIARDAFGRIDPQKQRGALELLYAPRIKPLHTVVGKAPPPPQPLSLFVGTFKVSPRSLGFGDHPAPRGLSLDQEMRAKRKAQEVQSAHRELCDVAGLRFTELNAFRPAFQQQGCWPSVLDVLCKVESLPQQATSVEPAAKVMEIGSARETRLRARAREICNESGIPDSIKPTKPQTLFSAIAPILIRGGYSRTQIYKYQKNPGRLPEKAKHSRGHHVPEEVVYLILTEDPEKRPHKAMLAETRTA